MTPFPTSTGVLIVGAGPTGLTLACALAAESVPFVIADRKAEPTRQSRAVVVHARTLEELDSIGVSESLAAAGRRIPRFGIRDRDRTLISFRFDLLPTRFPFMLVVPQSTTEAVLLDRLAELGVRPYRSMSLTGLSEAGGEAEATLLAGGSGPQTIRARYVVGCDGMHSTVREISGIGFAGGQSQESFVLADARLDWPFGDEVILFFSREGMVVVAPMPDGQYRIVAMMDDAPERPTLDTVQTLLARRGPAAHPIVVGEVTWSSRFRVSARLADRYRHSAVFLAGDAAHVHGPAGGQGMNIGIQDALSLASKLTAVLRGAAGESLLDQYESQRRPVAQSVVGLTNRMTKVGTARAPLARAARNTALRAASHVPPARRNFTMGLAGLR
jgi:2-polyprenyl-6-methoxyphenol hydroxylase-like FAD-dependent oxidoreductase